ncbi:hypothetical protein U9M48_011368 [Paspalum notatum var. saurae]|uniref:Flavin-containing monooxygenase n=1 Tax=Paspalum notatum var. saurae TaxID=547442 RepID=A0AAQ3SVL2_PASNO
MVSSSSSKKVCVVGAGVSGLISARELRREGHAVTVMEQSGGVGGQWLYEPSPDGGDPLGTAGVHSGVYASLRLNVPREGMGFSDFPFYPRVRGDGSGDARRFPGHQEFLSYIQDFCDAFGLMDAVRLNTKVLHVGLADDDDDDGTAMRSWVVRCAKKQGEEDEGEGVTEEVFDAVVVAVGQFSQPRLPSINGERINHSLNPAGLAPRFLLASDDQLMVMRAGMERWKRRHLHSHSYRVPGSFRDEVVVVVGCQESGKEIALELRQVAREVHVSVKSMDADGAVCPGMRKAVSRHRNLHLHPQIDRLVDDGQVVFADGSCVVADSVVYCTGYDYSFPFLDTAGGGLVVTVDDDNRVGPLFEHTFPPALAPSLSFVGVPSQVPFPHFYEAQARWVAQALSGRSPLPPPEEMARAVEEYHRAREAAGVPKRLSHAVFFDWEYMDEFGEKRCGFPRPPAWKKELLWACYARSLEHTESFRDDDDGCHDSDLVREGLRSQGVGDLNPMMTSSTTTSKKVCVVGAGISGLASARELRREGHQVTVMEQSGGVGGQWLYNDPSPDGGDPLGTAGVHSSMYSSVRLISPRELTGFSDFPFYPRSDGGGDPRRYPGHAEFLRYIRDFCDAFGLMDAVRLNTKVLHVGLLAAPRADDDGSSTTMRGWVVRCVEKQDEGEVVTTEEVFDAVVVAVGQCTQPRLPAIKGMDGWKRRQLHSHSYRVPDDSFHGEVVVVVGFHESGKDIALELAKVAREVHVSVKSMDAIAPGTLKALSRHRHRLRLHLEIDRLVDDGQVVFADGSCVVADTIIYCTGYDYSFPFLDTGGLVAVDENNRVGPLFEHTFPPALAPSLSFVGLPRLVLAPRFYEAQARWVAQVLSGRRSLPSPEEMMRSVEEYHAAREAAGVPRHLSHHIFFDMDYCDEFGEKHCGFPRVEEWRKELLRAAFARFRDGDTESFRDDDDYRDSDIVREGLRSEGWLLPPEVINKDDDDPP